MEYFKKMKIKDITEKLGELEVEELGIIGKFLILVALMKSEDAKITTDFFQLVDKKIDENFVKKKK